MNNSCNHATSKCIDIVPIFSGLSQQEKDKIFNVAKHKTLKKGEYAYFAGDEVNKLYIVHNGKLKIYRSNTDGKEQVIRILQNGDFTGELNLFNSNKANDFALAEQETNICTIGADDIKNFMLSHPNIAFKIIEVLSKRLNTAEHLIEQINLRSVEQRLATALLKMADNNGLVLLNTTKGNLASQLGMTQETLSRKLTMFQEKNIIKQLTNKKIKIINKDALQNF